MKIEGKNDNSSEKYSKRWIFYSSLLHFLYNHFLMSRKRKDLYGKIGKASGCQIANINFSENCCSLLLYVKYTYM